MSRKFLSVLLTVALVLCFMPVAGASSNLNIVDIDILDKMDDIHSALSEASKRGVYEDTYGGMYYDNGRIILLTTNASRETGSSVAAYKNDSDISIVSCDYTFAELETAWNIIVENASSIPKFVSVGISPKKNRVTLAVEDKTLLDSDKLAWVPSGVTEIVESDPIQPTASIGCGNTMKNSTRGSTSSCCVGVTTNSGINGLIIQGHETLVGDVIKNGSRQTIGSVTQRVQNTSMATRGPDACFVTLNSGNTVTNTIPEITGANAVVSGQTYTIPAGLPVHMRGHKTKPFSSGEVDEVSVYYQWTENRDGLTHYYVGAKASYPSKVGDSGGFVFVYTNLGPIWAGLQSGGGETVNYSVFAKATDIASYFGCYVP